MGKDTLIKYTIDHLRANKNGLRIVRRGFADKMYEVLHSLYGWAGFKERQHYIQNPKAKNDPIWNGKTVREMLIEFGTGLCRDKWDDDIWINACLRDLNKIDVLFVSDLRFPNEFNMVKELGGETIRVVRPGLPVPTDVADTALNGWEDHWDYTVTNDDTHGKLYKEAEAIASRLLVRI